MIQNKITISCGNSKMGKIPSVSLPSGLTCNNKAPCYKLCYAHKIERLRKVVKDSYQRNFDVWKRDPDEYWRQVEGAIMMSAFFRFHVSGDIPDETYLKYMVAICDRQQHCQCLCFTKQYDIVNKYIDSGGKIPHNLKIIFSAWPNFIMDNKYELPEAHIYFKDGTTTLNQYRDFIKCYGNCTKCVIDNGGCWNLEKGQQVLLKQH